MRGEEQTSKLFYELCALLLTILRSPHLAIPSSDASSEEAPPYPRPPLSVATARSRAARRPPVSPAGFASLLLGVSFALMLCGSVTFVIGFILMPWVIGLVMVFYLVGIVSSLSGLGRAILCPATPSPSASSPKDISGQLFSKLPII
ncbi:uncharacterized protein LOC103707859 isoform X1 [Phoenix dactylifera]|uniref:Uncharacterized protein LOC103707859 isoform X1 n=1 Tax=Phoenix dactylifera TaxID=42345 RepID=A0A8B7C3F7_PHODC|nr:uncharacterized protein LOC103707859 isoform X1 [Phoenix dactylifera]